MGDFKVKFDMADYKGTVFQKEDLIDYMKHDEILNYKAHEKGNIDKCIWQRHIPTAAEIASPWWREREATRILKTGAWIGIKDEIVFLPPSYYFALQYGRGGSSDLQFRLKRLKHVYFKILARKNPECKGSLTLKNRGDGETTMAITDAFWECLDGNTDVGQMGIQSRTRADCINPCWAYAQVLWQSIPAWLKKDLCSDFDSGNNIAEKMKWMRPANEEAGVKARNVLFTFYPSGTPMDGKHDMKKCILDEVCKWEECSFYDTFINYSKFIMPGGERRGMFDMFSSPADHDCESNREVASLWEDSDTDELTKYGTTKSRIHRYYSNPLDGIAGKYDKWGDANPDEIYDWIMETRASMPKDKRLAEIRGFPLNKEEMFGTFDGASLWYNISGIKERNIYLMGSRFKDEKTKEPARIYGQLVWKDGERDSEVEFRQADIDHLDVDIAKWSISYLPQEREALKTNPVTGALRPPRLPENCLGCDPIDKRYVPKDGKGFSNAALVNWKFADFYNTGIVRCPTLIYNCRPSHAEISFEDTIKTAVFCRSMVQTESVNSKIIDYFEDRGYMDWLISKRGQPRNSMNKGDSPKGTFMDEMILLIDEITNTPLNPGEPYLLEKNWFPELLNDFINFNRKLTQPSDLTMAFGQALMGAMKLLKKKVREPSELNDGVFDYWLG